MHIPLFKIPLSLNEIINIMLWDSLIEV